MAAALTQRVGLNATQLKYFATAMMVLDHWNMLFHPLIFLSVSRPLLSQSLYFLGRMAFPIFAFFVTEGLRHTHNRRSYLLRLGIFGGITQLPFLLGLLSGSGSVIATFFLAAAGVFAFDRMKRRLPKWISILPLLLFALLAHLAPTDYGWLGVLTVAAVYLTGDHSKQQLAILAVFMGLNYLPFTALTFPAAADWVAAGMAWLAVILLALVYNRQRGKGNKWFFYWFYPAHLVLLGGLAMIL